MYRHWEYLKYVLRHKWFVFLARLQLGVPLWIAIFHDWDKFLPGSWLAYAKTFYKPDGTKHYQPSPAFAAAWNRHEKWNKHHWQYWLLIWDRGEEEALPMPDVYRREMLADWIGAGKALGKPDTLAWYTANKDKMRLHPETRTWIEYRLKFVPPTHDDEMLKLLERELR
jgi:hypothetical protein